MGVIYLREGETSTLPFPPEDMTTHSDMLAISHVAGVGVFSDAIHTPFLQKHIPKPLLESASFNTSRGGPAVPRSLVVWLSHDLSSSGDDIRSCHVRSPQRPSYILLVEPFESSIRHFLRPHISDNL